MTKQARALLDGAYKRGAMTLRDHVILFGVGNDYARYKNLRGEASKLLSREPQYQALVGVVVFPSEKNQGKSPKWAPESVERRPDNQPEPDWSQSTALVEVKGLADSFDLTDVESKSAVSDAVTTIARAPKRVRDAVAIIGVAAFEKSKRQEIQIEALIEKNRLLTEMSEMQKTINLLQHTRPGLKAAS